MGETLVVGKTDWFFDFTGLKKLSDEARARGVEQEKHKAKLKKGAADQKQAVKRSQAKVEYDALRLEVEAARDGLEPFRPLADGAFETLNQALKTSDTQISNPDPEAALATLKACKAAKLLETAASAFDKGRNKAAGAFPDLFKLQGEREAEIKAAGDVLTDAQMAEALAACHAATAPVVAVPDAAHVREAQVALGKAYDAFDATLVAARGVRDDTDTERQRAKQAIADAGSVLTPAQMALPGARVKAGEALMTGKDFAAARDAFAEAASVLEDALKADAGARTKWATLATTLLALQTKATEQAGWFTRHAKGALLDTRGNLQQATLGLQSLQDTPPQPGGARGFSDAVTLAEQIRDQLDGVDDAITNYKTFRAARTAARDAVAEAAAKAEGAIGAVTATIKSTPSIEGRQDDGYVPGTHVLLDGFTTRLHQARAVWEKRLTSAADVTTLRAEDAVNSIAAITAEVQALSNDPSRLGGALQGSAVRSARSRLEAAVAAAEAAIDALALRDLVEALPKQEELARLRKQADKARSGKAVDRATSAIAALGKQAEAIPGDDAPSPDSVRPALHERIKALDAALEQRWAQIEKVSDNKERDALVALHGSYKTMLESQRAMADEDQPTLLAGCDEALTDLEELVEALGENFGTNKAMRIVRSVLPTKTTGTSMADLMARVDQLTARLDRKGDVKIFAGDTVFELQDRLGTLGKSLGTQTPAKVAAQLDGIETEIEAAKTAAAEARTRYNAVKLRIEAAKKSLDGAALFVLVPNLRDQLKSELDAVRAGCRQQGGPDPALERDLAGLEERIAKPGKTPNGDDVAVNPRGVPVTLEQQEADLIEAQKLFEVQKASWDKRAELLRADIKSMRGDDSALTKDMLKRLADAGKAYKKLEDQGVAETMMTAIRQQCERVDANPDGLRVHARNRLPQVKQRWKTAVAYFRAGSDALGKAINGYSDPDLDDTAKGEAAKAITHVNALFNAALFDAPIARIMAEGAEETEQAAAREDALRDLRRMRAALDQDGRLVALSRDTSFATGLGAQLSELRLSLADVEQNLLVSL